MGIPSVLKTDNGPAFTSHLLRSFLSEWNITHITGIPYNPQSQAIIETAHCPLKTHLLKQKGGIWKRRYTSYPINPQLLLSLTLYSLNFNNSDTRAEDKNSKLEINTPVWYKQFNQWLPGILRLLGKGYGLVVADGVEIWVPLRYIHYWEGPQDWTPSGNDEVNAKSLINDPEGAGEETPSSESLPDMGSSEKT